MAMYMVSAIDLVRLLSIATRAETDEETAAEIMGVLQRANPTLGTSRILAAGQADEPAESDERFPYAKPE